MTAEAASTILTEPTVTCGYSACDKTFPMDPHSSQIYCSGDCRNRARKQRNKQARQAEMAQKEAAGLICPCAQCGNNVHLDKPKENPKTPSFCSEFCAQHAMNAQLTQKQKNRLKQKKTVSIKKHPSTEGKCRNCHKSTSAPVGKPVPKYCSDECREAVHDKRRESTHKKRIETKESVCVECDKVFQRTYEDSFSYCSGGCRNANLFKIAVRKGLTKRPRCINGRGKYRYDSPFHAQEVADRHIDDTLTVYPCTTCGAYHIGHLRGYELEIVSVPRSYVIYKRLRKIGFLPNPSYLKKKSGPKHLAEKLPFAETIKSISLNNPKHRKS